MFSKFLLAFMAFFAMMNPISNLPAYMALVAGENQKISKAIARRSLLVAFTITVVFIVSGHMIFELFGITIDALRIAGGILVGLIGYRMIAGYHASNANTLPTDKSIDPMSLAISPLAMSLFAGPGTIATAITLSFGGFDNQLVTIVAFAVLCLLTYYLLLAAKPISQFLGDNFMNVITRMMGLILTTIGIQMLIIGIKGAFLR